MTALNAAMADQLRDFKVEVDALIEKGVKKDEAIFQVIKKLIELSKPVHFDGDGYSAEWRDEAKKRGLSNITSCPASMLTYLEPQAKKVLVAGGIMGEKELEARVEIELEKYMKKIQIESRVLGDIATNHIIPIAVEYQSKLIQNVQGLKDIFGGAELDKVAGNRKALIIEISGRIDRIQEKVDAMTEARKECNAIEHADKKAFAYESKVVPFFEEIRYEIDKLELTVDNEMWPLPKYRELLFNR